MSPPGPSRPIDATPRAAGADFGPTKEQGVSPMLTINLNDVEKELSIK